MNMRRLILLMLLIFVTENIFCQNKFIENDFHPPLDIPLLLSGNFAELRSNHFHSGIDIKTQGVTGKKVYAIENGYVSRIKVQTNGYGHSVYINHPGGYTSVYAHLQKYNEKIDQYVKQYQYRNQTYEVDIYPSPEDLIIEKGELIAFSGNTGSSGGPHLHFEIRETATQKPLNVLEFGFDIRDNIPPRLYSFFIYDIAGNGKDRKVSGRKEYPLKKNGNHYSFRGPVALDSKHRFAVGVETYDFLNDSPNRCGIFTLELFVNNELKYLFKTNKFSFAESRYINAHMDYALKAETGRRTHNLFLLPNENLSMNEPGLNEGIIAPENEDTINVRILATDVYGNRSEVLFPVTFLQQEKQTEEPKENQEFLWYQTNQYSTDEFMINLPQNALYENTIFTYNKKQGKNSFYPWVHQVHNEAVPLHKNSDLSIKTENIPEKYLDKTAIVKLDKKGKPEFVGGKISKGWITAPIREFGEYTLEVDTVAPVLYPLNIHMNSDMKGHKRISFKVKDDLSGVSEYRAYIDNQWVLLEYDPKSSLLFYEFDPQRLNAGLNHELEVYISDALGNSNLYHSSFYW